MSDEKIDLAALIASKPQTNEPLKLADIEDMLKELWESAPTQPTITLPTGTVLALFDDGWDGETPVTMDQVKRVRRRDAERTERGAPPRSGSTPGRTPRTPHTAPSPEPGG